MGKVAGETEDPVVIIGAIIIHTAIGARSAG